MRRERGQLAVGHVDDGEHVERRERGSGAIDVGERVERVAAADHQGAQVAGLDLVDHRHARVLAEHRAKFGTARWAWRDGRRVRAPP